MNTCTQKHPLTIIKNVIKTTLIIIGPILALTLVLPAVLPLLSEHATVTRTSAPFTLTPTEQQKEFITQRGRKLIIKTQHPINTQSSDNTFVFKQIEFRSGYSRPCIAPATSTSPDQCQRFSIDEFEFINIETAMMKL